MKHEGCSSKASLLFKYFLCLGIPERSITKFYIYGPKLGKRLLEADKDATFFIERHSNKIQWFCHTAIALKEDSGTV